MTCSLFAPVPQLVLEAVERGREAAGKEGVTKKEQQGEVVISGDFDGDIKIFINQRKVDWQEVDTDLVDEDSESESDSDWKHASQNLHNKCESNQIVVIYIYCDPSIL